MSNPNGNPNVALPMSGKHLLAGLMVIMSLADLFATYGHIGPVRPIMTTIFTSLGAYGLITLWIYWNVQTFTPTFVSLIVVVVPTIAIILIWVNLLFGS